VADHPQKLLELFAREQWTTVSGHVGGHFINCHRVLPVTGVVSCAAFQQERGHPGP
jgi:hypothetical protein